MKDTFIITFLLCILTNIQSFSQTTDTISHVSTYVDSDSLTTKAHIDPYAGTDDFSPMQLFFVLALMGVVLLAVGAGIVLTVLALLIIFGLITYGVLSTSIIIALNAKSFSKGFKNFLCIGSAVGGIILGGSSFGVFNKVVHWWTMTDAILIGATCGLIGGFCFGYLTFYILQRLTTYFKNHLNTVIK